jgi:hypothetical protein
MKFNKDAIIASEPQRVQQEASTLFRRLQRQGRKEYVVQVAQELQRRAQTLDKGNGGAG